MCSRLSTTPSWQRRIGNKITSSRSRLESKFSIWYFHLWLRAIAVYQCPLYGCIVAPIYPSYDLDHQKISGNPWLHLRGRHGRDDQLGKTRPKSCLRLRPRGLQGPQGQLSKMSWTFHSWDDAPRSPRERERHLSRWKCGKQDLPSCAVV